ncbi:MAG TPA: PrsW family glutamic-type intramembrane protease [Planctomycetota bacterium]|nr:PrsW family glutamic-type intramembrane protease [Planctomycetota bacterium]
MPEVSCPCGQRFEAPPGETACPGCGALHAVTAPDRLQVGCACGAKLNVPLRLAGTLVTCPKCAQAVQVPSSPVPGAGGGSIDLKPIPEPATPDVGAGPSAPRTGAPPRTAPPPPPAPEGWRKFGRWALAAALLPLIFSSFSKEDEPMKRLEKMIQEDPGLAQKIKHLKDHGDSSEDDLFAVLPDHRIEGAHLPRSTMIHWVYALVSAAAFWGFILLVYPMGNSTSKQLWSVGVFTGTIGIFLLLALQWAATFSRGVGIRGGGKLAILILLIQLIGFSYSAALGDTGFILSMLGFTFGVGLCEELCKTLPLFWHFRSKATLDLRGAVVWGLASGIGFGVSEGITYSSDSYNGITTGGIYVVRFVSCVALHAVWSAASSILLWRRQTEVQGVETWFQWFAPLFKILGVSMVLHALYDTALKKEVEPVAIVTAIASFAWFFWLYERARKEEAALARGAVA